MSAYKFLNESLLDNVETDEVEDVDIEIEDSFDGKKPLVWSFEYEYTVPSVTEEYISKVMRRSDCVERLDEILVDDGYERGIGIIKRCQVCVRFHPRHVGFGRFCELLAALILPTEKLVMLDGRDCKIRLNYRDAEKSEDTRAMISDIKISSCIKFVEFFKPVAERLGVTADYCDICCHMVSALFVRDRLNAGKKPFLVVENDNRQVHLIGRGGKVLAVGSGSGYSFHNGFAGFGDKSSGYVYVGEDGKSRTVVSAYRPFSADGFAVVFRPDGTENYIDRDWITLSGRWFDKCHDFVNGFGKVVKDGKFNFIDRNGNLVSKTWFDDCGLFDEFGMAVVITYSSSGSSTYNYINSSGELLLDRDYGACIPFKDGLGCVFDIDYDHSNERICNYVNKEGRFISDQWFVQDSGRLVKNHSFSGGYVCVRNRSGGYNIMDAEGNLLFESWSYEVRFGRFSEGFCSFLEYGNGYGFIDRNGNIITKELFEKVQEFRDGFAVVTKLGNDSLMNFINTKGNLMLPWMDPNDISAYTPMNGLLLTMDGFCIDSDGCFVSLV